MKEWLINLFKTYFVVYFPLVIVFTASLYNPSDSDLGWHLRYGEYFFSHGRILRENTFSTMMPNYSWVNSSWATDLITYGIFRLGGFFGLSVLTALVLTLTYWLFAKSAKLSFWEQTFIFPLLVYFEEPLAVVSFRGHLLTLLFLGMLFYLFKQFEEGKRKAILLTLPLFMIWANIHGEFILGLAIFFGWIILHRERQILWILLGKRGKLSEILPDLRYLLVIFSGTLFATIIHPYGWKIYQETLHHFGNPLQKFIIEWLPFSTFSHLWWNLVIWTVLVILGIVILLWKRRFTENLPYIGLTIILVILSFWVRRYTWPMLLVSVPVIKGIFSLLEPKNKTLSLVISSGIYIASYLFVILMMQPVQHLYGMNWTRYCLEYVQCSPKGAEFLTAYDPKGKLFTFYNWGGWLIWNYPQIKPSIDGRMHLWKDDTGYSAFAEYYPVEQNFNDIDKTQYDVVFMSTKKPMYKRLVELVKLRQWKVLYQDELGGVFEKAVQENKRHPD